MDSLTLNKFYAIQIILKLISQRCSKNNNQHLSLKRFDYQYNTNTLLHITPLKIKNILARLFRRCDGKEKRPTERMFNKIN